jgi:hypothetical protein
VFRKLKQELGYSEVSGTHDVKHNHTARDFLQHMDFSPAIAHKRFRNARQRLLGGLFVSHSGSDYHEILEKIVHPVFYDLIVGEWYFVHSRVSGGASGYRQLVQAALHWCDKFIVIISERSITNEWVLAEVEWALDHGRPILAVELDECCWKDIVERLPVERGPMRKVPTFRFGDNLAAAQHELAQSLRSLLIDFPWGNAI